MPRIDLGFTPEPKQAPAFVSTAISKLLGGARGGGKTKTLAQMAIELSVSYPGNIGYALRADLEDFKKSTLQEILRSIPDGLLIQWNKSEKYVDIATADPKHPSRIWYGEGKDETSLLSTNLGWFLIDEAFEVSRRTYTHLHGTLRLKLPDGTYPPYHALLASNPSPGWLMDLFPVQEDEQKLYHRLYDDAANHARRVNLRGKLIEYDTAFFPFLAQDNSHNPPDYMARLMKQYGHDPILLARYVYGKWDMNMEGLVYRLLAEHRWNASEVGERLYDPTAPVQLALDPSNGAGIYAGLVIQVVGTAVHVVGEFYKNGGIDEDFLAWVHNQPFANDITDAICDNAKADTIKRLSLQGLPIRGVKSKDVTGQINAVKGLMHVDPRTKRANLLIDEGQCPNLVREFGLRSFQARDKTSRLYVEDSPGSSRVSERPIKAWDHALNALEYWTIMKMPVPGQRRLVIPKPTGSLPRYLGGVAKPKHKWYRV